MDAEAKEGVIWKVEMKKRNQMEKNKVKRGKRVDAEGVLVISGSILDIEKNTVKN